MNDILKRILATKSDEIAQAKQVLSLEAIQEQAMACPERRGFVEAICQRHQSSQPAVIAEVKKASPSKGVIRDFFDPAAIAADYAGHGAACLSVLTDRQYFQGHLQNLRIAREVCALPLLRKDFIIDPYQVYEAVVYGADCILLIVAVLPTDKLQALAELAESLNLAVLVEVHDKAELEIALMLNTPLIGINNRNLKTFEVSLANTFDLLPDVGQNRIVVTESGISTPEDVNQMQVRGVNTFLVGEAFMREAAPGEALSRLFDMINNN